VREAAAAACGIDPALANHLVMGPAILARAEVAPFAVKIHGSALEYTVKPHPRFLPYAREGVEAASGVLTGSGHTAESLWEALADLPDLPAKTRLGPPGVDIEEFQPQGEREPLVAFVGKLIVSKGVDLLLAAWPLVWAANPEVRLKVAGFGAYEEALRRLLAALEEGDLDAAREIARRGWALEGGEERPLPILSSFLADPPGGYAETARAAAGSVEFIGRLEHHEVASFFPRAEAMVMPSTFPEAFGMVAVEAAACGTLPASAAHSGMLEVSRQLAADLPAPIDQLVSFPVEEGAVEAIAARLNRWLALPENQREAGRQALVETVRRLWSWEGVAHGVLAAAAGELGDLPSPDS
jgi:glycosyltransferase involved in cell wall biosynthesis